MLRMVAQNRQSQQTAITRQSLRVIVLGLILLTGALYLATIPISFSYIQTLCARNDAWTCRRQLMPQELRALEHAGVATTTFAAAVVTITTISVAIFFGIALLIWLRKRHDSYVLLGALALAAFGASRFDEDIWAILASIHPLLHLAVTLIQAAALPLFLAFFLLFPTGHFVPRWIRWFVYFVALDSVLGILFPGSFLDPNGNIVISLALAAALV